MTDTPTPHRIALIGPGGAGKSTLAAALAERLGLPLIDGTFSNAKRLVAQYDTTDDVRPRLEQQIGMMHQVAAEARHRATGFVSSRSIYDFMVYSDLRGVTWPADGPQPLLADARRWWREIGGYTLVVYVPPWSDAPPEDDGRRSVDPEFVERERRAFRLMWRHSNPGALATVEATELLNRTIEAEGLLCRYNGRQWPSRLLENHNLIMNGVAAAREAMR